MNKTKKKTKKAKKQKVYIVKWGYEENDPIEQFDNLEEAKDKVRELIEDGEEMADIMIYVVLAKLQPVSSDITFEEL